MRLSAETDAAFAPEGGVSDFDVARYTVEIKRVSLDVGDRYEGGVAELPDVVEYAATPDAAYALAIAAIVRLRGAAMETGKTFPDPKPPQAADQIRAYALVDPPEHADAVWPKLDKPARVGSAEFALGVNSRLVVVAAQRAYQYAGDHRDLTPAEARAEEIARRTLWDERNGPIRI